VVAVTGHRPGRPRRRLQQKKGGGRTSERPFQIRLHVRFEFVSIVFELVSVSNSFRPFRTREKYFARKSTTDPRYGHGYPALTRRTRPIYELGPRSLEICQDELEQKFRASPRTSFLGIFPGPADPGSAVRAGSGRNFCRNLMASTSGFNLLRRRRQRWRRRRGGIVVDAGYLHP